MTSNIRFTDEAFSFLQNGVAYRVHTEVGEGRPARVVIEEVKPEPISDEASE